MKNTIITLIVSCLLIGLQYDAKAQTNFWSSEATYSPHNTTLFGANSRFGYHDNNKSTYFMRYNDSSYFCSTIYSTVTTTPTSCKVWVPGSLIINYFKKFHYYQGYIGSYDGVGMYGFTPCYNSTILNSFDIYKLTAVDQLNRIAVIKSSDVSIIPFQLKAFAVGDKVLSKGLKQSFLLEFYAQGEGLFVPYHYAPLFVDYNTGNQEIADDVIVVGKRVVFATRDTRNRHAPVNLRISDTNNVLSNTNIDIQWQLWLPSNQELRSELRLRHLKDDDFVLAYIIYDTQVEKYYLCTNRINLNDFIVLNNTIVSHKILLGTDCTNLVDIVYVPDVNTLVLLLNGNDKSEFYHTTPYSNTSTSTTQLYYPNGNLYSIDTIGDYPYLYHNIYVAMGDNRFFSQNVSYGTAIFKSCLSITELDMLLQTHPSIDKIKDPLARYSDMKQLYRHETDGVYFFGQTSCTIFDNE